MSMILPPKWCGVWHQHAEHQWAEPQGMTSIYRHCPGSAATTKRDTAQPKETDDELARVADAATPGPWVSNRVVVSQREEDGGRFVMCDPQSDAREEDAQHIATFDPPMVKRLLAALAATEEALAESRTEYETARATCRRMAAALADAERRGAVRALRDLDERCQRADERLQALEADASTSTSAQRIHAKRNGVALVRSYIEETIRADRIESERGGHE